MIVGIVITVVATIIVIIAIIRTRGDDKA